MKDVTFSRIMSGKEKQQSGHETHWIEIISEDEHDLIYSEYLQGSGSFKIQKI